MRPHLFSRAKGSLKKSMQIRAGCSGRSGGFVGLLCLAEDFRLSDHHRIETGRDAKQMLGALGIFVTVKCGGITRDVGVEIAGDASRHLLSGYGAISCGINLNPVTGVEDKRFGTTVFAE